MKARAIHVSEEAYRDFKAIAARTGRPVAELIRDAMSHYLEENPRGRLSILDLVPHASGRLRKRWKRQEILEEMLRS